MVLRVNNFMNRSEQIFALNDWYCMLLSSFDRVFKQCFCIVWIVDTFTIIF